MLTNRASYIDVYKSVPSKVQKLRNLRNIWANLLDLSNSVYGNYDDFLEIMMMEIIIWKPNKVWANIDNLSDDSSKEITSLKINGKTFTQGWYQPRARALIRTGRKRTGRYHRTATECGRINEAISRRHRIPGTKAQTHRDITPRDSPNRQLSSQSKWISTSGLECKQYPWDCHVCE